MHYFLLFSIVSTFTNVYSFDPGCSFFNGQCVYNVKLGHEGQCDHSKRAAGDNSASSSGIQVCSTDLETALGLTRKPFYTSDDENEVCAANNLTLLKSHLQSVMPQGCKTFFMLHSNEHYIISIAHKSYNNEKKFFLLKMNVKMSTIARSQLIFRKKIN